MAYLVDTNILVYRFDPRFPDKQGVARDLLRKALIDDAARIPHQALLEFVAKRGTRARTGLPRRTKGRIPNGSKRTHLPEILSRGRRNGSARGLLPDL